MANGTAIIERSILAHYAIGRKWHRSKDTKKMPYSEFASYMVNKKWWLEEKFNVHMMRFQQVRCIMINMLDMFHSRLVC